MEILQGFVDAVVGIFEDSGLLTLNWQNYVMIGISIVLLYLAIKKQYEPLLLLPIAFGMLLVNLYPSIMAPPTTQLLTEAQCTAQNIAVSGHAKTVIDGVTYIENPTYGGLLYYLYQGVKLGIYPPLIFLGIGCMTDFGPLISNPKSLILGAAAQIGIFLTFTGAIFLGFTEAEAGAIGIIGGADGPTAIYVTTKLAPHLLGSIAIAAYSYMALVPIVQPPVIKAVTTKKERLIRMKYTAGDVTKTTKILFPIVVTIIAGIVAPKSVALVGFLMFGNLIRECGVLNNLSETAQNSFANILTILLGITVASQMYYEDFVKPQTLLILGLGLVAFIFDTVGGVVFAKFLNLFLPKEKKINPMIGAAGISAFPMSGRVVNQMGLKEDNQNFLLMQSISVNVSGQVASVIAGGLILTLVS